MILMDTTSIIDVVKAKASELEGAKQKVKAAKAEVAAIKADIRGARKAFADALRQTPGKAAKPRGPRKAKAQKPAAGEAAETA
jgi:outer membrane protein TolC